MRNRLQRQEKLLTELANLINAIDKTDVVKILLFGSLARGTVRSTSDVDLMIIKNTTLHLFDRVDEIYKNYAPRVAVDIMVYTPAEVTSMCQWSRFMIRALKEGKVLYESSA